MKYALLPLLLATSALSAQNYVIQGISDLDECAAENRYDTGYCLKPLEAYAAKNPQMLFEIGQRARLHFASWAALRFFAPGLGAKPTEAMCKDEQLAIAVISGIGRPEGYDGLKEAQEILNGPCFAALRPTLEKEVADPAAGYVATNGCPILAAKGVKLAACEPKPKLDSAGFQIGLIKAYKGPEGERVSIAELKNHPGFVLVRIDGVTGKSNGSVRLHKEVKEGDRVRYWTEIDGKQWNTVVGRKQSGYTDLTAFIPDAGEISIGYSEDASQETKPDAFNKPL
jgi:hypothetical protein